jgi:hypothetical protein
MSRLVDLWKFLIDHDLPNWVSLFVSLVVWPPITAVIVLWWSRRTRQTLPHFLVTLTAGQGTIDNHPVSGVYIKFINQTRSIAYLSRARLIEMPRNFSVSPLASRDIARAWRELSLGIPPNYAFDRYETILQTDIGHDRAIAFIATSQPPEDELYDYRPPRWRRLLGRPKYFRLEYVVVIGDKKYQISTVY